MPQQGQRTRSSRWSYDHPGRQEQAWYRAKGSIHQPFQGQQQRRTLGSTMDTKHGQRRQGNGTFAQTGSSKPS